MKVEIRPCGGQQILVPGQCFVPPGDEFTTVERDENVEFLIDAQAVEVAPAADTDLDTLTVPQLEAEVQRRELTVTGTGTGGKVVKSDLVDALRAAINTDESQEDR